MITYPVNELFHTFQGEGVHVGSPAFFVRLHGCPVHCPWCDSAGTWHPTHVPKDVQRMTVEQIMDEIPPSAVTVVITGGEPAIHDLMPLTDVLCDLDYNIHLETSGAFPINGEFDWITLSPKKWKPPIPYSVALAEEFKLIIETPEDIMLYTEMIGGKEKKKRDRPIWLHPEWSHREDPIVLTAIAEAVKQADYNYRAGWQLHKLYKVDALDNRTRPLVPLGGDPQKGF